MIRRILDLTTAHLTKRTADSLWDGECYASLAIEVGGAEPAFVLLNVPPIDEGDEPFADWPADLKAVALFARAHDCDFVKFDVDGLEVDGLPTYEW